MNRKTAAIIICMLVGAILVAHTASARLCDGFAGFLEEMTVSEDIIPRGSSFDVIYILGGSPSSLKEKHAKVGRLSQVVEYKKIAILDRPGITEYSEEIGRNLTNNEWSIRQLEKEGIIEEDLELVSTTGGYFGTLSEAQAVTELMKVRGYRTALLVTAPHHTKRVKRSFKRMLSGTGRECFVTSSEEKAPIGELLMENIKLAVYTLILLPAQG
jgi:hypothetical protein